ncbi:hypothetical protein [Croceicoccus naphthovorans]|uniref:Uncharacterized protein n=1 Tax=Croceicoccus naphthovorans TaxID=1348774 RepID=A0A0G3XE21_9SPHN|nr:hypothetical protein [Croceicoccus naphthovorans]AKM08854.1 hypothetical protein AB433_00845 [Croceicoccus naphthovorans]MBB3992296.1 hypothetical protein [Croceicoccus naphthovorans]
MSFWTAIVIIVAIVALGKVIQSRHNAMAGFGSDQDGNAVPRPDNGDAERLQAEVEELKERIKVLERIAYDDRKRLGLADEIESLRD